MARVIYVPPETLELAREMRAAGESWGAIGRATGFDRDVIRWRIDLAWVARRGGRGDDASMSRYTYKTSDEDLRRMRASIPRDTRSRMAKWMGDPLPGRSALDQRRAVGEVFHAKLHIVSLEMRDKSERGFSGYPQTTNWNFWGR